MGKGLECTSPKQIYRWQIAHEKMTNIVGLWGNANKSHNEITTSQALGWLESESQIITSAGEDVEKSEPSDVARGDVKEKWCSHCGLSSPQNAHCGVTV